MKNRKRGFTLIELLVVISIIALLLGILLPALGRAQDNANKIKDGTQVRGIMQAMVQWASDTGGSFPNPDRFQGVRPGGLGEMESEARTGAILSMMIMQQTIVPELCVSPSEAGQIVPYEGYHYDDVPGVANQNNAFYDPTFKGSPVDHETVYSAAQSDMLQSDIGHNSYAHMVISGARANFWENTLSASTPIWANRGPVYDEVMTPEPPATWTLEEGQRGTESAALAVHGGGQSWEGNVAFADGHVDFFDQPDPSDITFLEDQGGGSGGAPFTQNDNMFVDEQNEGTTNSTIQTRRNAILRIFHTGIPNDDPLEAGGLEPGLNNVVWVDGVFAN